MDSNHITQRKHYVTVSLQTQYSHFIIPDQSPSATCTSHSFLVACSMEWGLPLYTDLDSPPSAFLAIPERFLLPHLVLSDNHRLAACPSENILLVTVDLRRRQSFIPQYGCVVVSPGLVYSLVLHGDHLVLVWNKTGQIRLMHQQPLRRDTMMFLGTTGASQLVVLCSDWLSNVRQICRQNCPFVLLSFSRTFPPTFPLFFSHISF